MVDHARELLRQLIEDDDCAAIAKLLESSPGLRDSLNDPMFAWDMPPLAGAQSVEAAELLHVHGADYDAVGEWWAPGFFVRSVDKQVGRHLAQQGAPLTPHAAAGIRKAKMRKLFTARVPVLLKLSSRIESPVLSEQSTCDSDMPR